MQPLKFTGQTFSWNDRTLVWFGGIRDRRIPMEAPSRHDRLCLQLVELTPALRRFAGRFERKPDDAEDLVQETLMKAIGNLSRFEEGTKLKSWVFTIMRNAFNTRYSLRRREVVGGMEDVSAEPRVAASQDWAMEYADFQTAFERLPKTHQQALQIVLMEGESYERAAEICCCKVGTIKSRVFRGRQMLANDIHGSSPIQ
jgi:RNA polymerase sigma-70 factor (ECF subfamily)